MIRCRHHHSWHDVGIYFSRGVGVAYAAYREDTREGEDCAGEGEEAQAKGAGEVDFEVCRAAGVGRIDHGDEEGRSQGEWEGLEC